MNVTYRPSVDRLRAGSDLDEKLVTRSPPEWPLLFGISSEFTNRPDRCEPVEDDRRGDTEVGIGRTLFHTSG
jgi:hypothetical protein